MRCDEVAEHVSAICDGETIPHDAAEHLRECTVCTGLMQEYIMLGATLRREASLEFSAPSTPQWKRKTGIIPRFWQKAWGTMRIPRAAFAAVVLLALVAIGASWKMIGVGAEGTGSFVRLSVEMAGRSEPAVCYLSVVDSTDGGCGFGGRFDPVKNATSAVGFRAAGRIADGVRLIVKTTTYARPSGASASKGPDVEKQSSREMLLVPGEPLKMQVEGMGTVTLRAEWMDHRPSWLAAQGNVDPGPTELRISNPFLLKGDTRISDISANARVGNGFERGVAIVFPNAGRYVLSLAPIKDAVEGNIKENRIDFEYEGAKYVLLTGAPIARQENAWIQVQPNYEDPNCRRCFGVSMPDIRSMTIKK